MAQSGSESQVTGTLVASRYLDVLGSNLPIDERISLSKLSPSDIPAWADARMQDYRRRLKEIEGYIATFGSLRNTQSSIHVLPSELLAKIFIYACSTRRELRIARVCRHWCAVVMSTPHVWANAIESKRLDFKQTADQDFLRVALAKSGSLPITIAPTYGFHAAWNILSPHFFRLVSLTMQAYSDDEVATLAAALSSGSLLNMRTLRVTCAYSTPPPLLLDSQYLPHLRELYIEGALLTSTSTVGSTLEDLTIAGRLAAREPWHVLGRALQRCAALRTLALLSGPMPAEWAHQADSYDADLQAVSLPRLRTVVFRDEAKQLRKMLSCLPIPSSTMVSIIIEPSGTIFPDAVPNDYMQRFHTQPLIDRLHFIYPSDRMGYTAARCYAGGQERLRTATQIYGEDDLRVFLEPLFGACEHGALHTLAIDMMHTRDLTSWNLLFQRLPHLRRLELFAQTPCVAMEHFAATFLRNRGDHSTDAESSGLTLAKVFLLRRSREDVLYELGALASVLEGAVTRCARLELYAVKPSEEEEAFQSLAAIPTDPDLFRTIAAPILPRLSSLVDVLTIH